METVEARPPLTRRQAEVYDFLRDQILNRGYGPTVREIGEKFNIKSPNGVMCHLRALEKKGLIRRDPHMSRAICLPETVRKQMSVPFIGTAVSGNPIQSAVSSDETIEFEPLFTGDDKACLQVKGNAFQAIGICDGDYVIVNRGAHGKRGSLVAALDDRHSVTVHRVPDEGKQPVPAISGAYLSPTRQILGTIVGVVRHVKDEDSEASSPNHSSGAESAVA